MDNSDVKTAQQVGAEIYAQLFEILSIELSLHPEISDLHKSLLVTTAIGHLLFKLYHQAGIQKKTVKSIILTMLKDEYEQ